MTKRLKIAVGINSLVATRWQAYSNHIQFFYRLGRSYTDIDFMLVNPPRMSIDRMRNMTATVALEGEFDYVLFLDDDVLVPIDCLKKLIALDADVAAGDVIIRGYPFQHMMFRYKDKAKTRLLAMSNLPSGPRGPIDVDAVGFSLCLIKTSVFKLDGMEAPYFITGTHNTEDIYFCLKAKDLNPDLTIKVDTSITCGHILWDEFINTDTKAAFKRYYEQINPDLEDPDESINRGTHYLARTKATIAKGKKK